MTTLVQRQALSTARKIAIGSFILTTLRLWAQRRRQRRELSLMTELDLHDIGMTQSDATWQMRKPFWQE
jgi:uncharacterized protein YjiS (DUF1127 family)